MLPVIKKKTVPIFLIKTAFSKVVQESECLFGQLLLTSIQLT